MLWSSRSNPCVLALPRSQSHVNRLLFTTLFAIGGFVAVAAVTTRNNGGKVESVLDTPKLDDETLAVGLFLETASDLLDLKIDSPASGVWNKWLAGPYRASSDATANSAPERPARKLEEDTTTPPPLWESIYMSIVLILMFITLISEKIKPEWVMITTLTACMLAGLIDSAEALVGFSNAGVISIMVLFVVAEGLGNTGALDWYMNILLGKPKSIADAQLRVICPVSVVFVRSMFLHRFK